jgi:hypothetical protein
MQFSEKRTTLRSVVAELVDLDNEFSVQLRTSARCGLAFAFRRVATSIPLFVSFEVGTIDTLRWLRLLTTLWLWALIAVLWIETVVYLAPELVIAMKPRSGANEYVPAKPFWTVVARRRTVIRSDVIVTVGAFRGYPDVDADLSLRLGGGCSKTTPSNSS